ncbi:MAG: hypothetical protein JO264_16555 [Acidisphaera sp.]|nr:hypothetical protein [Acidisphaera sp.]
MSDSPEDSPTLEAEFDCMLSRAGITIPPERRGPALAAFVELRQQTALLRQPRSAAAEPSNIFRLPHPGAL